MTARRGVDADWVLGAAGVGFGAWPLVGRDDELALASAALRTHGCVVLMGAAGVGKTRLAHEVLARAGSEGDRAEWVTATQSAAAVPLGAVAHLVPEAAIGRGRDATLRGVVAALTRAGRGRLLLGVDDAHLLDDASAALVHLLVTSGSASATVTVRSGEQAPDSVVSLWKDGPAPLVVLQALSRAEVETIVATVLQDPVDGATSQFLWESSRGNALFLRELIHHGVESGALRCERDLWSWHGRLQPGERLQNLVALRMGSVSEAEQAALELVAVGQPITVACLQQLGVAGVVTRLERRGLVASPPQQPGVIALAHPLFGEVLRERMPSTRRNEVRVDLANALEATCDGSPADHSKIAMWRVEAGDRSRPDQAVAAASRALRLWEPAVAERLARAALESGPDMGAAVLLGAALSDQNRAEEALAAVRTARSLPGSDRLRASAANVEAGVLSHQLHRLADAEQVLSETLDQVSDARARATLEGARAAIVVSGGFRPPGAPDPDASVVPTAALASLIENATAGRLDRAVQIATDQLATASEWTDEFPTIELYLQLAQTWALTLSGRIIDAQVRADAGYAAAVDGHAEFPRLTWSFVRGMIFVARGLPHSATRALREAAAGFEVTDRGFLRPTRTYLAMASALAGDPAAAEQHLQGAHDAQASYEALFAVDLLRAESWLSAARGEVSHAVDQAWRAAEDAVAREAWGLEVGALHDVARFGHPAEVVHRLEVITELVDGELVDSVSAHARALVDGHGSALDAVSRSFASLQLELFAAEASAAAAHSHRGAGRRSSAFAARDRARELIARCESAQTPALAWLEQPEELTAREREIADMARLDLTSREIAERLGVTTRTVDNLLGRVYAKLGISGRKQLAELLGPPVST